MKIPDHHFQFSQHPALLLVTSKESARGFIAHQGTVEEVLNFRTGKPQYSDNEGFFGSRRARQGSAFTGSVLKPVDFIAERDFVLELSHRLQTLMQKMVVEEIYVFLPQELYTTIEKHLNREVHKRIKHRIFGYYTRRSPLELIEILEPELKPKTVRLFTSEVGKILKKAKDASEFLRPGKHKVKHNRLQPGQ